MAVELILQLKEMVKHLWSIINTYKIQNSNFEDLVNYVNGLDEESIKFKIPDITTNKTIEAASALVTMSSESTIDLVSPKRKKSIDDNTNPIKRTCIVDNCTRIPQMDKDKCFSHEVYN
jgi:hypothetical protein